MNRKTLIMFAATALLPSILHASLKAFVVVPKSQPVILHVIYDGLIPSWDGNFIVYGEDRLILENSARLQVFDPKGQELAPQPGKIQRLWKDAILNRSFDVEINLSKFFKLTDPGQYTVTWGSGTNENSIAFEIQ